MPAGTHGMEEFPKTDQTHGKKTDEKENSAHIHQSDHDENQNHTADRSLKHPYPSLIFCRRIGAAVRHS